MPTSRCSVCTAAQVPESQRSAQGTPVVAGTSPFEVSRSRTPHVVTGAEPAGRGAVYLCALV